MAYLIDTNVLVRWINRRDPQHAVADRALRRLHMMQREPLHVTAQNLIELWSVATRPVGSNGLGQTPGRARTLVDETRRLFPLLLEGDRVFEHWLLLATAVAVSGRRVHDTRLAAIMLVHGITHLLTFNETDFTRFGSFGITTVHPASV